MKTLPLVLAFTILGTCALPLHADDKSHAEIAGKLIDITNGKEQLRAGFETVMNQLLDNLKQRGMPQSGVDEMKGTISAWYDKEVHFEDIRPKMVDIFTKDFTEDDLKQIVAFYESPVGQKAVKMLPMAQRETAGVAQEYMKEKTGPLNEQLGQIVAKYRDQMAAAQGGSPMGGMPATSGTAGK